MFERVRQPAEVLADGRRPRRQRPREGWRSNSPRQVAERSPRMFKVASAFSWPALGTPAIIPYCCCTAGSEAVASIRPNSRGGPSYLSRSGKIVAALTVAVGKHSGDPARTVPGASATAAPSSVTSTLATPL